MTVQHTPLKWPPYRPVDWVDCSERAAWALEFQEHLFNLFGASMQREDPMT